MKLISSLLDSAGLRSFNLKPFMHLIDCKVSILGFLGAKLTWFTEKIFMLCSVDSEPVLESWDEHHADLSERRTLDYEFDITDCPLAMNVYVMFKCWEHFKKPIKHSYIHFNNPK